jgi:hypothetical protein
LEVTFVQKRKEQTVKIFYEYGREPTILYGELSIIYDTDRDKKNMSLRKFPLVAEQDKKKKLVYIRVNY